MSPLEPTGDVAADTERLRGWLDQQHPPPLLIATSGSTGEPKRVLLSREAVLASAEASLRRLGGPGAWLLALPTSTIAGVQAVVRSYVSGREPVPAYAGPASALGGSTAGAGPAPRYAALVPTQLHRALAAEDPADRTALADLDAVLLGGGPVDAGLREQAERAGITAVAGYGSSETAGGCVYDGRPLDGVGVTTGTDGRIRIAGPVLFEGYEGQPALTAQVLADGWFHTADVGELDHDGRLRVLGRVDDMVVSGGVNVPAATVARRLREHPAVEAAEVVGVPDEEWGQQVVACVVGAAEPATGLAGLRDWVARTLPRSWAPRALRRLPEMPMLGSGKPDRELLRRLAREPDAVHHGTPGDDDAAATPGTSSEEPGR